MREVGCSARAPGHCGHLACPSSAVQKGGAGNRSPLWPLTGAPCTEDPAGGNTAQGWLGGGVGSI